MTLRFGWPSRAASQEWLGDRLFFGHARYFASTMRLTSVVSSRLGRSAQHLPRWSFHLERVLQETARTNDSLLVAEGTTLARPLVHFARQANIDRCIVQAAKEKQSLSDWLKRLFQNENQSPDPNLVLLSPLVVQSGIEEQTPIRDRVAVGLADRVFAIYLRSSGNTSQLLQRRLKNTSQHFCAGSTRIVRDQSELRGSTPKQRKRIEQSQNQWMELGAVFWVLQDKQQSPELSATERNRLGCQKRCMSASSRRQVSVHQLVMPLRTFTACSQHTAQFLVHCTRGGRETSPQKSSVTKLTETWRHGQECTDHPFSTLVQIASEARLRASNRMTRVTRPTVSFSHVPVDELLARRSFQSHLGRWDWEPYGLLIDRAALSSRGARPVIYGDEDQFKDLSPDDRAFFQPKLGNRGSRQNWEREEEWRHIGDLRLQELPRESIYLFTRTHSQAQYLSRHFPWPCIYVESLHVPHL